jgi:hypothetical protein
MNVKRSLARGYSRGLVRGQGKIGKVEGMRLGQREVDERMKKRSP